MKKNLMLITLLIMMCCSFNIKNVYAYIEYSSNNFPECTSNGECLALCAYENTWSETMGTGNNKTEKTITTSSYIYYKYNNRTFYADFYGSEKDLVHTKKLGKVFIDTDRSITGFVCPKKSFVDTNMVGLSTEVCFQSTAGFCKGNNNLGTTFKGDGERKYNFEDSIKDYYSNKKNYLYGLSCDSDDFNFNEDTLTNKLITDFSKNFLSGHKIPAFINNNSVYNNQVNKQKKTIKTFVNECVDKITNDSTLSKEEKEKRLKEANLSDGKIDEILSNVNNAIVSGKYNSELLVDIDSADCESLLGDKTNPSHPAYFVNYAFNIVKYIAILVLILFSMLDYGKAVISKDEDAVKKATANSIKRLIYCIIIFLIPGLISYLMELSGFYSPEICGLE